jgi:hypothetical protein
MNDTQYMEFVAQGINAAVLFAAVVAIIWSGVDGGGRS